jgi:hypothetical protein
LSFGGEAEGAILLDDERSLARLLVRRGWGFGRGDYYYRVNMISRDLKVTPDIDLLNVYVNQWHPEENTATGIELKVLKYHRGRKRIELAPFYQGLGQVLTYFRHGIDRAALVVGFHTETDQFPDEVAAAQKLLKEHGDQLKASVLSNFPCLQIACIRGENMEWIVHSADWDKARFFHQSDDSKLRRDNIFKIQFTLNKGAFGADLLGWSRYAD